MNLSKRTSLLAIVMATAATVTVPLYGHEPPERSTVQSPDGEPTVLGAWRTQVRFRDCETGEVMPAPPNRGFRLFTFHRGGTASEYGIGPGLTPALRSPGHGVWQREPGSHQYSYAFTFTRYDAAGLFAGSTIVRSALVLDASGDAFTANSAVEVLDAGGNVALTACTAVTGTRFK